jgi:hypothetical protein
MGIKFILTETQVKKLVESLNEEAAGYDDFNVMNQHGTKSMTILSDTLQDLTYVFSGIKTMLSSKNIDISDLKKNLYEAIELIDEINMTTKIVFKDFTDRKTIMKGEIMHRKLESYQEKIRLMAGMDEELLDKESLMKRLYTITTNILNYVKDYATSLYDANTTFTNRVEKGKPNRKSDMN